MPLVLGYREIARMISRLALEIADGRHRDEPLALVGIHTRGVPLARRLAAEIEKHEGAMPLFGTVDITLYRDDFGSPRFDPEVRETELSFPLAGTRVVLVDDVLYTGRTVRAAIDNLLDFGRPSRIELLVLIERPGRELPIASTYVGKKMEARGDEDVQVRLSEIDSGEDEVRIVRREDKVPS